MLSTDASPSAWRIALAFVVAPLVAAVAAVSFDSLNVGLPDPIWRLLGMAIGIAVIGAYPPTLVLGVPAFFVLRRRLRPTALNCVLVGAVVAAVPWLLVSLLMPGSNNAMLLDHATRIDERTTLWSWYVLGRFVAVVAAAGAVGGAVFWLVAAAYVPRWPPER